MTIKGLLQNKGIVRLIGALIFIVILTRIDFSKIIEAFLITNLFYYLGGLALTLPVVGLSAIRWQKILSILNIKYSLKDCFAVYSIGLYIGLLTPGKLGDFIKVLYLAKEKFSVRRSLISVAGDKVFDFIALLVFGIAGMAVFFKDSLNSLFYLTLSMLIAGMVLYITCCRKRGSTLLARITDSLVPEKYKDSIKVNNLLDDLRLFKGRDAIWLSVLTLTRWSIFFILSYILVLSLDIDISFLNATISIAVASIAAVLPISIAGIGTRDAALILMFSELGLSAEKAVAFSLLHLSISVLMVIIGFVFWMQRPLKAD
ncbi:MAG: lysylphosphatidylglycerol synthase transmembrane domain-containing protein [Thermodesulfobacteriota bacterium]